jgi:hypothetical protein
MSLRARGAPAALAVAFARDAAAHDAFGDLGPFYASLLHPLADPAQGLLLSALAVLLARQSLDAVRPAYVALAVGGAAGVLLGAFMGVQAPGQRLAAVAALLLGLAAAAGLRLGPGVATAVAAASSIAAGLASDLAPGLRPGILAATGGALGIALGGLLAWGLIDLLQRRFGRVAGAVAGSWIAAVGLMTAALPA